MDPVERGSVKILVAENKDARCVRAMSDNSLAAGPTCVTAAGGQWPVGLQSVRNSSLQIAARDYGYFQLHLDAPGADDAGISTSAAPF